MEFETGKILSGVGALLIAIGLLTGGILTIIGFILLLIGLNGLAKVYYEERIFKNALYAVITGIIGIIVVIITTIVIFGSTLIIPQAKIFNNTLTVTSSIVIMSFLTSLLIILAILEAFLIIVALFFKKSFNLLATKSGEELFNTAGLLLLIGATLTIIFIGVFIMLIAWILATVAFFTMKPPEKPAYQPPPPPL